MSRQEFSQLLKAMHTMYGTDFINDSDEMELWFQLLEDLDYIVLSQAIKKHMLTSVFKPTVAELREEYNSLFMDGEIEDNWGAAWKNVMDAVHLYGSYEQSIALNSMDDVTRQAVEQIGYYNICMSENIQSERARFADIYNILVKRKKAELTMGGALPRIMKIVKERKLMMLEEDVSLVNNEDKELSGITKESDSNGQ